MGFDGRSNHDASRDRLALEKAVHLAAFATAQDDVAPTGFTFEATGTPKATMRLHRDLLIIVDG